MKLLSVFIIALSITLLSANLKAETQKTIRETKSFGISLTMIGMMDAAGPTGITLNYIVNPNLDIELNLGILNGVALKIYTNRDSNWNFYLGAGASIVLPMPMAPDVWMAYAPIGVQYLNKNGFQASLDLGVSYISTGVNHSRVEPAKTEVKPMSRIKIGYHF